jgi:hypothetical protein
VHGFWPVEDLADGPAGCGEVVTGLAFICLEPQCGKVNCTYGGGEKTLDQT